MSYSFSAKGATKDAALADATAKLDQTIEQQPVHSRDREAALSNLRTHLDLIDEPKEDEDVTISMHGSISVQHLAAGADRVTNAGSGCSVYVGRRVA